MLTQYKTLFDVKSGRFDQPFSVSELRNENHYGIGTFNHIHGEMVVANGEVFRGLPDGSAVAITDESERFPYASICDMASLRDRKQFRLEYCQSLPDLEQRLVECIGNKELWCLIVGKGEFESVVTRAPYRSVPPYPSLEEIIGGQPRVTAGACSGQLIGFYTPQHLSALGVPGFHLHFLSEDRSRAGHVSEVAVRWIDVTVGHISQIKLHL